MLSTSSSFSTLSTLTSVVLLGGIILPLKYCYCQEKKATDGSCFFSFNVLFLLCSSRANELRPLGFTIFARLEFSGFSFFFPPSPPPSPPSSLPFPMQLCCEGVSYRWFCRSVVCLLFPDTPPLHMKPGGVEQCRDRQPHNQRGVSWSSKPKPRIHTHAHTHTDTHTRHWREELYF